MKITYPTRKVICLSLVTVIIVMTVGIVSMAVLYPQKIDSLRVSSKELMSDSWASVSVSLPDLNMPDIADIEWNNPIKPSIWYNHTQVTVTGFTSHAYNSIKSSILIPVDYIATIPQSIKMPSISMAGFFTASSYSRNEYDENANDQSLNDINPSSGDVSLYELKKTKGSPQDLLPIQTQDPDIAQDIQTEKDFLFGEFETQSITAEAVLVPRAKTVISSSRDGKIAEINVDNGDHFKKGDILLKYHCAAIKEEIDAAVVQNRFAREKRKVITQLYDLELASRLEALEAQVESKKAIATKVATEDQNNDCIIRADYDGRVVKRLANPGEYTRTDRVLLEVASKGTLNAEFLLPSLWLRWVNVDAPITLTLHETGASYTGKVQRIFGEVDPVSQSIQIRANLDEYDHPLLPGMSGKITLDIEQIRSAGIRGFLDVKQ